eukprot:2406374-Lingulodinium_polyedra.AAC.1
MCIRDSLKADHGAAGRPARVKRRWEDVRRGPGRPQVKAATRPVGPAPRPPGPPPVGCHDLARTGVSCRAWRA